MVFNVEYTHNFFQKSESAEIYKYLFKITERQKTLTYSDDALPWTPLLIQLRDRVEKETGYAYNTLLIRHLTDGSDCIAQNREENFSCFPEVIISFGETRKMVFKKPSDEIRSIVLEDGSLCVISDPTNRHFSRGVPPDILKKGDHFNLLFKHEVKTLERKRPRMEFEDALFGGNDLLSQLCRETIGPTPMYPRPSSSLVNQWDLGANDFVQVHFEKNILKLHIRHFSLCDEGFLRPTKHGVMVANSTWVDFAEKLTFFGFSDAFIFNKQLLLVPVDSETCIFQQMFDGNVTGFLKLTKPQLSKLEKCIPEISKCLIQTHLTKLFPHLILSKGEICLEHFQTEEEAKNYLINCIQNEIEIALQILYPCAGCLFNDPSQFNHECVITPFEEKFPLYREKILLTLNVYAIVRHLTEKCTCHFTQDFLTQFEFPYFSDYLLSCCEIIE